MSTRPTIQALERRTLLAASVVGTPAVIDINKETGAQFDPTIAVDPANPMIVFAAASDTTNPTPPSGTNFSDSLMGAYSQDGGTTWHARRFASGIDGLPQALGQASAVFDQFGNLFVAYVRQDSMQTELLLSIDGGVSFRLLSSFNGAEVALPEVAVGHNSVWVAMEKAPVAGAPPSLSSAGTVAYGARVSTLGQVGSFHGEVVAQPASNLSGIAVGPGGQVLVAYQYHGNLGPSHIYTRLDPDGLGPRGFGSVNSQITANVGNPNFLIPAQPDQGISAHPQVVYDTSGGPFTGRVYMVYTDAATPTIADPNAAIDGTPTIPNPDTDIELRFSDDDGTTWSQPIRVNDDATTFSQYLNALSIDPTTGTVGIAWYDARNDTFSPNQRVQIFATVAAPAPGGVSLSPNFIVQPAASTPAFSGEPNDLGGYIGSSFYAGQFHVGWTDLSNSTHDNPDGGHADIYTASATISTTAQPARTLLGQFGTVGGVLRFTDANGTIVTASLNRGRGYAFLDGGNIDLHVVGTDSHSVLTLTPHGTQPLSLGNVLVNGALGSLIAPRTTLAGTLSIQGLVSRVILGSVSGGTFAASGGIGTFTALALTNAKVLSGANPGPDGVFSGGTDVDDSFAAGSITSLRVNGAIAASVIGAGVNPVDGIFGNGNDTIIGNSVIHMIFAKSADAATRFEAAAFGKVLLPTLTTPSAPQFVT